jgi:hypothetical protein
VRRLLTPRWLLVHAGAVVLVIGFLGMGWWQLTRAAEGNLLSFGYAIEWPVFAAFVVWVWIKEVRKATHSDDAPPAVPGPEPEPPRDPGPSSSRAPRTSRQRPRSGPAYDDSDDADLAAYNRYLAWRSANPHADPNAYVDPAGQPEERT